MITYQEQTNNFIHNGTYQYQLDVFGNFVVDENNPSFSTQYLKVGLYDFNYDVNKIESLLPSVKFEEFIPVLSTPINANVNTSNNYVESVLAAGGSINSVPSQIIAELEYTIQQLKADRDDANTKLNNIVAKLTPPA
jgi:hypothetical protein